MYNNNNMRQSYYCSGSYPPILYRTRINILNGKELTESILHYLTRIHVPHVYDYEKNDDGDVRFIVLCFVLLLF